MPPGPLRNAGDLALPWKILLCCRCSWSLVLIFLFALDVRWLVAPSVPALFNFCPSLLLGVFTL